MRPITGRCIVERSVDFGRRCVVGCILAYFVWIGGSEIASGQIREPGSETGKAQARPALITRRIVNDEDGSPVAGALVLITKDHDAGIDSGREVSVGTPDRYTSDKDGLVKAMVDRSNKLSDPRLVSFHISHPQYVPLAQHVDATVLFENIEKQSRHMEIRLLPAAYCEGRLISPEGAPIPNVPIQGFTVPTEIGVGKPRSTRGRPVLVTSATDADGLFRLPVARGGQAIYCFQPRDLAPVIASVMANGRELDIVRAESGASVRIRVLNVDGTSAKGVRVIAHRTAERSGRVPDRSDLHRLTPQLYWRAANSGADGTCSLAPMATGMYEFHVDDAVDAVTESTTSPKEQVFIDHVEEIARSGQEIVLRAVHAVDLIARVQEIDGAASSGVAFVATWRASTSPSRIYIAHSIEAEKGLLKATIPAQAAEIGVRLSRQGVGACIIQPSAGISLSSDDQCKLLSDGVSILPEIKITQFRPTAIIVKVVGADQQPISGVIPRLVYQVVPGDERLARPESVSKPLNWNEVGNGRWRFESVVPGRKFIVMGGDKNAIGRTEPTELRDGEIKEIQLRLAPSDDTKVER